MAINKRGKVLPSDEFEYEFEVYDEETEKTLLIKARSLEEAEGIADTIDFNDYRDGSVVDVLDEMDSYNEYAKGGLTRKHRRRKKSLEERAEMLVGSSTWHDLNRIEKADVISEMVSEGLLPYVPMMARGGMIGNYKVGDIVKVSSNNDNENYDDFRYKKLRIVDKITIKDNHPAFDDALEDQALYSFEDVETNEDIPFSLYDYELQSYMAKGGVTADSLKVRYTLANNEVVEVEYDSKEAMDNGIADFYLTNDVEAVEVVEVETKKEEKKGLFDMAKKAPAKKSASKEKPEVIVEGIESEIARYDALKEIINNAKAEQEIIGGKLKQIGKEEFLGLYEEYNRKPDNFNLADGDEKILFIVMDKYKKVEPEKEALLEQYDGLLEKVTTYSFNPEVLDRIGDQVSDLILNSDLSEADKKNLLIVETTTTIRKGSIDRLADYEDPEEIFNLIEPILALK
jgi:hypothetical protein